MEKTILDPCCGSRMMWFDREHEGAVFGDQRAETITVTDRSRGNASGTRTLRIEPDVLMDFRDIPYPDGTFKLVAFDPPHLVQAGPKSWLAAKYGKLGPDWRNDIRKGFTECLRVLEPGGVLVFKWNETQVKVSEVLALAPQRPLFGQVSGHKGMTHWLVFMKPSGEQGGRVMAETFKVWRPDYGQTEEDAKRFEAFDESHAAEKWAKWSDADSADYNIAGGTEATVMVRSAGGSLHEFNVYGESVPSYSAYPVERATKKEN